MNDRLAAATAYVAVLFVCVGFISLGAAAGLRMAIGLTTQTADCAQFACVDVVRVFDQQMEILFFAGAAVLVCGLVLVWYRQNRMIKSEVNSST